jgi:hypothetical protein
MGEASGAAFGGRSLRPAFAEECRAICVQTGKIKTQRPLRARGAEKFPAAKAASNASPPTPAAREFSDDLMGGLFLVSEREGGLNPFWVRCVFVVNSG